jgi:outer membrane protein assembly factor BamD
MENSFYASLTKEHLKHEEYMTTLRSHFNTTSKAFYVGCLVGLLTGCGDSDRVYEQKPLTTLYKTAMKDLKSEDFEEATQNFDEVERQYPYSSWAPHAQLMSAYCAFKAQKFPKAIATLETFLALHPASKDAAYAHYLRALSYYTDLLSPHRDSENAILALQGFKEICQRFPYTDYARDAELKIDFLQEHLASQTMIVIRDYLRRKQFVAAFDRIVYLVQEYPRSILIPEALYRLIECHIALGFPGLTYKTVALLKYNFPQHTWTAMASNLLKNSAVKKAKRKKSKAPQNQ